MLDALRGDFSRSVRGDELDASWRIFTPLLKDVDEMEVGPREYAYGKSWLFLLCFCRCKRHEISAMGDLSFNADGCAFQARRVHKVWRSS